jgi:uncharacterized protein (TIGR02996 family)
MPDGVELLKEIAANPRDPCPRFVYADWLEEAGSRDADWWRESHAVETAISLRYGNSDGYGDGDGDGYGYGYGYGYGNGDGNGYGYGDGNGDGNGNGYGYGYGYGYGNGDGNGNGYGYGYGYGYGESLMRLEVLMEGKFLFVCENGFVLCGVASPHPTDFLRVVIDRAGVVRRWGTTKGLGQLAAEGPLRETTIDPAGDGVECLRAWIKCAIPLNEAAWKEYLK